MSILDLGMSGLFTSGSIFRPGEELELSFISPALASAIQVGHLEVISQEVSDKLVVAEDGQSTFQLPFPWPGPDYVDLVVGGLVQEFGEDWTVSPESNLVMWLDSEIELEEGESLLLIRRLR
jgi:hypothetical protein